jgi:hypothetical protein
VPLEEQRLTRTTPAPQRPDVRTSRRDLLYTHLEALPFKIIRDVTSRPSLVPLGVVRTENAGDADEVPYETDQLLAVDLVPHILQVFEKPGVPRRPHFLLRQRAASPVYAPCLPP